MVEKATKFYEVFQSVKQKQLEDGDRLLQVICLYNMILSPYPTEWGEIIEPKIKQRFSWQKNPSSRKQIHIQQKKFSTLTILKLVFLSLDPDL